jgi:hypothetical protein
MPYELKWDRNLEEYEKLRDAGCSNVRHYNSLKFEVFLFRILAILFIYGYLTESIKIKLPV